MATLRNHILDGPHGPLLLDAWLTDAPAPVVVFCHGFKGFKDWGHFNLMAQRMADAGLNFVKFNFSHNGTTPEQPESFADLEAFGNNNLSIELDDLGHVMDWAAQQASVQKNTIYLAGHSRGGASVVLKSAEDARVKRLVTWAAVHDLEAWLSRNELEQWRATGVLHFPNARTGQQMPMYYQMYENFVANRNRLAIPQQAPTLQIPTLIVHGTADEAVPEAAAHALHSWISGSELMIVPQANHVFGIAHPFTGGALPEHAAQVLNATVDFFTRPA